MSEETTITYEEYQDLARMAGMSVKQASTRKETEPGQTVPVVSCPQCHSKIPTGRKDCYRCHWNGERKG